ncbi:hypothetical protein J3R83DRAFT_9555 [Lanmaoa asiatica]|nr:hypothetical protein J3R83DRAFT_9555 [Lanmaoa asiatica]
MTKLPVIKIYPANDGKPDKHTSRRSVRMTLTVTLESDSSSADELARGRKESEAIDSDESPSGATTVQQRAEATAGSEHGRTIPFPSKSRQKLARGTIEAAHAQPVVSGPLPRIANTVTDDERQRRRPILKAVNGASRDSGTKRKAPRDDDELIKVSDSAQPHGKKTKTSTCDHAQQTSGPSGNNTQDSNSDEFSAMFPGGMPGEEESQWKHELYDGMMAKAHAARGCLSVKPRTRPHVTFALTSELDENGQNIDADYELVKGAKDDEEE